MVLPCFICRKVSKDVKTFTESTFSKCVHILNIRKQRMMAYADVTLPLEFAELNCGYHRKCYGTFTAVKSSIIEAHQEPGPSNAAPRTPPATRSVDIVSTSVHSRTGVFHKVCIFCKKERRKIKQEVQPLHCVTTLNFEENLRNECVTMNDFNFLRDIGVSDFVSKEVRYHLRCRLEYLSKFQRATAAQPKGNLYSDTFDATMIYLKQFVLEDKQVLYLSNLLEVFTTFHQQYTGLTSHSYTTQHLEDKIRVKFPETIQIRKVGSRKVICGNDISEEQLSVLLNAGKEERQLQEAAFLLRRKILSIKPDKLPTDLSFDLLKKGETEVPEVLIDFFSDLIVGPSGHRRRTTGKTFRDAKSIASDLIYSVTSGRIMPAKQIMVGLAIKSATGSRKVIDILNKYNQCVSYHKIEEIETEICFSQSDGSTISPSGLTLSPSLSTAVAFNNFDRYVETLSGKNTLHDTVGICHQLHSPSPPPKPNRLDPPPGKSKMKRRRLYVPVHDEELMPYKKKPKMMSEILPLSDTKRISSSPPLSLSKAAQKDFLWFLSVALHIPKIPMWIGYNAMMGKDDSPQQKVCYLSTINESPTSTTVVQETMFRAQKIADECGQKEIMVTYDLAVAKIAMQIQSTESPTFDNLFIQMGDFHIIMAYFKAIGKFIEESGLPYILGQTDILADGSTNGFLGGTHYNRCKRIHPINYVAIRSLLFDRFVEESGMNFDDTLTDEIKLVNNTAQFSLSPNLVTISVEFERFTQRAIKGDLGKTPQFYTIYLKLVENYFLFTRAIREGDFELYKTIVPAINAVFFAFNQPNYARWLVKYESELLLLDETHPDVAESFKKGLFGIKRTNTNFSRSPVDLVLEQTINADAENKLRGISHMTNSIAARQRWARNHTFRTEVLSALYAELELKRKEDVSKEVMNHRIEKDTSAVEALKSGITEHINPFDRNVDPSCLINIATGKAASTDTEEYLLHIESTGEAARRAFIEGCVEDVYRFERPIKRQKISTFVSERSKAIKSNNENLKQTILIKDYFARLLAVSFEQQVDLGEVLKFELTPTPRSFTHPDGTMHKSEKSALSRHLEKMVKSSPPLTTDVTLIDGFFLIHQIREIPRTFYELARKVLHASLNFSAHEIHLIFDKQVSPSIKDSERARRKIEGSSSISIIGPNQLVPKNFFQHLRDNSFKNNLVRFFLSQWVKNEMSEFFGNKKLFVNSDDLCLIINKDQDSGGVHHEESQQFSCSHEEADTRIIYHIGQLPQPKNVVVRCNDTDILVILLANMGNLGNHHVWMEVGQYTKNTHRYIDVTELFHILTPEVAQGLASLHAFTGCDFTASFFKKGKVKPFVLFHRNPTYVNFFASLHELDCKTASDVAERFVCELYGIKNCSSVDEARLICFENAYRPKNPNEPLFKNFKKFEPQGIPPTKRSLQKKLLRSIYISKVWMNATQENQDTDPEQHGWEIIEGAYCPVWFDGDMAPKNLMDIVIKDDSDDDGGYSSSEDEKD